MNSTYLSSDGISNTSTEYYYPSIRHVPTAAMAHNSLSPTNIGLYDLGGESLPPLMAQ